MGHNVAYDTAVVCARFPQLRRSVFDAYGEDRVTDTMIRQWLLDNAAGVLRGRLGEKGQWYEYKYTLEALAKRNAGMQLVKDGWRLSYGEFVDTPLENWPRRAREVQEAAQPRVAELERAIAAEIDDTRVKALSKERDGLVEMINGDPNRASEYPLDDARATLAVYLAQEAHSVYLADQFRQARAYFALHLSSTWGLRTDAKGVDILQREVQTAYNALELDLITLGLIRNDKKRTRDTKAAKTRMIRVCIEEGLPLRRTEAHAQEDEEKSKCRDAEGNKLPPGDERCTEHVCLDSEACSATDDDVLHDYSEATTLKKVLSNDVKALLQGILYPVHTHYGFAETGRTTSSRPNIQNVRKLPGIRECFVPRPGMVFVAADFPALEAYAWAQCCFTRLGRSKLAEALNAGLDPHLALAAQILGLSYKETKRRYVAGDQEVADIRQLAKVGNFGFPGGMGAPKLLAAAKKQLNQTSPGLVERLGLDLERMKKLKEHWLATWPEAAPYFARIKSIGPPYPQKYRATVETLFTKRVRGNATYCAASNNDFQGLGADCAKEAAWRICRAQYVEPSSPLYNTRTVAFVHDEFLIEAPRETAHEAAEALADTMVAGANTYLRDVPIPRAKLEPVIMNRWSKKAKPVLRDGRLVPWEM